MKYYCVPSVNDPAFVAHMEDVLDIYEMPYDPDLPVLCMDEKPLQLLDHAREPIPMAPGRERIEDSEYVRNGTCSIFMLCEPKKGLRFVTAREHRTAVDWAEEMAGFLNTYYPGDGRIILVCDNLNTHTIGFFYKVFEAPEARAFVKRLDIHYTPKHGSWLNIAEARTQRPHPPVPGQEALVPGGSPEGDQGMVGGQE